MKETIIIPKLGQNNKMLLVAKEIELGSGNIDDVKVDGISVVTGKVANIDLTNKQDKLPNASASGQVLKSTDTTGGIEWGDASSGSTLDSYLFEVSDWTGTTEAGYSLTTSRNGIPVGIFQYNSIDNSYSSVANVTYTMISGAVVLTSSFAFKGKLELASMDAVGTAHTLADYGIIDGQSKLPNASASGKVLKSTNTTGGIEWGDQSTGYPPDNDTITLNDDNQLKIKDSSITYTQLNSNLVSTSLPTEDPSTTKLTAESAVVNGLATKQDKLTAGEGISIAADGTISVSFPVAEEQEF